MKASLLVYLIFYFLCSYSQGPVYQWGKSFDGGNSGSYIRDMVVDDEGYIYLTGEYTDTVDFDPGPDTSFLYADDYPNGFILKLDGQGNFEWVIDIRDYSYNDPFALKYQIGSSLSINENNELIAVGNFFNEVDFDPGPGTNVISSLAENDSYILKLDLDGNLIWVKTFAGTHIDATWQVQTGPSNEILVCGVYGGQTDFDPGPGVEMHTSNLGFVGHAYLAMLDDNGNFQWAHTYGSFLSRCESITFDDSGNIYAIGSFEDTIDIEPGPGVTLINNQPPYQDIVIYKLDPSGDLLWYKQVLGDNLNEGKVIKLDSEGSIYYTGRQRGTTDHDPGPNVFNVTSQSFNSSFLTKLDDQGNFVWTANIDNGLTSPYSSMKIDDSDNIYIVGSFADSITLNLPFETLNFNLGGFNDMFFMKLDSSGALMWFQIIGGQDSQSAGAIDINPENIFFVAGSFKEQVDLDPGPGNAIFNATGLNGDSFVAEYGDGFLNLSNQNNFEEAIIYPNPAHESVHIMNVGELPVLILNSEGKVVMNSMHSTEGIDISSLSNGTYFIQYTLDNRTIVTRFLKS